jgi:oligosaccharide repeat unit polymerase
MLLATLVVLIRHARRRLDTPVDVVCLFVATWSCVLLVFAVPVIRYAPTRAEVWLLVYGSIGAGVAGCLFAWRQWTPRAAAVNEQHQQLRATIDPHRLRLVWLASVMLGFVGSVGFVLAVDRVAGWQAVFNDPARVRAITRDSLEFQNAYGFWKLLTYCNQIAFVMWTIGLRLRMFTGRWRAGGLLGFVSLVPFLFTADRNLLAAALALACMVHVLWPWSGSWRRAAIGLAAAIVVAAAGLTAVGNRYGSSLADHPELASYVTSGFTSVAIPYLYVTANIPTFGQLTQDDLAPRTDGQMAVLPAVKAAARAGLIDHAPVETGVFYPIPFEAFSNYSWLGSFWLDFRVIGILLMPFLVGYLAASARLRLVAKSTFLTLWTAALLLYVIVYSPLSNVLSTSLTWQYLLLGPVLAAVLQPGTTKRWSSALTARRSLSLAAFAGAAAVSAGMLFVISVRSPTRREPLTVTQLNEAVEKARHVYERTGRYPVSLGLSTRLAVNRPGMLFRPQQTYTAPLPPTGTIAVFTAPKDVFLRTRGGDGRIYEVHRTEDFGGVTFGPGTRDR